MYSPVRDRDQGAPYGPLDQFEKLFDYYDQISIYISTRSPHPPSPLLRLLPPPRAHPLLTSPSPLSARPKTLLVFIHFWIVIQLENFERLTPTSFTTPIFGDAQLQARSPSWIELRLYKATLDRARARGSHKTIRSPARFCATDIYLFTINGHSIWTRIDHEVLANVYSSIDIHLCRVTKSVGRFWKIAIFIKFLSETKF